MKPTYRAFSSDTRVAAAPARKRGCGDGSGGAAASKRAKATGPSGLAAGASAALEAASGSASVLPAMLGADVALELCDDDYD